MKIGDLVKNNRQSVIYSTSNGERLPVDSFGLVVKNDYQRKLTRVLWSHMEYASWVPSHLLDVL